MTLNESDLNNIEVLDRICELYGFSQKMQLANHYGIAASSLSNRYRRGAISYDFAVSCCLETGANLKWIITGQGPRFPNDEVKNEDSELRLFTLSEGELVENGVLRISENLFSKALKRPQCVKSDGKTHFVEQSAQLSDGTWLVDIEGAVSIRDLTLLPARKLHVAGGKVPFECGTDDIKTLGRVVGIYSEVN